jgi:hypothetical protein
MSGTSAPWYLGENDDDPKNQYDEKNSLHYCAVSEFVFVSNAV